ncbi:MAG: hypothetical protein HKM89_05605 [Gemmatimonadales bacterium]|nr:hypothetical protein [Gemmatimonadales bacterium]
MNLVSTIRALGPIDAKNVARDPLLRWVLVFGLLIGLALRLGVPPLPEYLEATYQFDLTAYYVLIMSTCLLFVPALVGTVVGFLLLDQRDDRTLDALQVTPLTVTGYLWYRIATPMLLSVALTPVVLLIANLVSLDAPLLVLMSLVAAPFAALMALAIASLAQNKVQGFALSKASGLVTMPPIVAYFVAGKWQFAFGLVPTYWPVKAYWSAAAGGSEFWIYLAIATVYQGVLLVVLARHFRRVVSR